MRLRSEWRFRRFRTSLRPTAGASSSCRSTRSVGQCRSGWRSRERTAAECILPRPMLEGMVTGIMRRHAPEVRSVSIDDPREHPDYVETGTLRGRASGRGRHGGGWYGDSGRCPGTWWAPPPSKRSGRANLVRRVRFPSTSAVGSAFPRWFVLGGSRTDCGGRRGRRAEQQRPTWPRSRIAEHRHTAQRAPSPKEEA